MTKRNANHGWKLSLPSILFLQTGNGSFADEPEEAVLGSPDHKEAEEQVAGDSRTSNSNQ